MPSHSLGTLGCVPSCLLCTLVSPGRSSGAGGAGMLRDRSFHSLQPTSAGGILDQRLSFLNRNVEDEWSFSKWEQEQKYKE